MKVHPYSMIEIETLDSYKRFYYTACSPNYQKREIETPKVAPTIEPRVRREEKVKFMLPSTKEWLV